jgi:hypothetical protein
MSTSTETTCESAAPATASARGRSPQHPPGETVRRDPAAAAISDWLARIGAASVIELAAACGLSERVVAARLRRCELAGLTHSARLLHGQPALHALSARGLRAAGRAELEPVTFSASGFAHTLALARVALALERAGTRVSGERELRAFERLEGRALASAEVGMARDGGVALHRPDLVCWGGQRPIAIEVELTVKAPERLATIIRGWARSRLVERVVYYATPAAERALARAVRSESAEGRVVVIELDRAGELPVAGSTSSIPSGP